VKIAPTATDGSAGALVKTGNPLDVALDGDGFFGVETARGVRWSRAGNLRLDAEQRLVTGDGNPVRARGGGAITLPQSAQEIVVAEDGTISADGEAVGAIELARFAPNAVAREGASLFAARGPALPGEGPKVVSGALESGNFNVVRGVVDLVRVSRTYDALHRMIESYREMDERTARGGQ
jgi:flagellar basal-body rod protein FlgF